MSGKLSLALWIFFLLLHLVAANLNTNITAEPISPYITLTPIQKEIDAFLRLGYRQLDNGMLVNIKADNDNHLLAYLVSNGSVFVFNTDYVPERHALKILGVL
jgi:hypothetical protein